MGKVFLIIGSFFGCISCFPAENKLVGSDSDLPALEKKISESTLSVWLGTQTLDTDTVATPERVVSRIVSTADLPKNSQSFSVSTITPLLPKTFVRRKSDSDLLLNKRDELLTVAEGRAHGDSR